MSTFRWIFAATAAICLPLLAFAQDGNESLVIGPRPDATPSAARGESGKLRAKLLNGTPAESAAAIEGLVQAGGPESSAAFWELYNRGTALQRVQAIRAIGRMRQNDNIDYLLRVAVGDMFQAVRFAAAEELARAESREKAVARLLAIIQDPNPRLVPLLRIRALYALAHIGGSTALPALKIFLAPKYGEMAMAAAEGIGMLGDPAAAEVLVHALENADENLKPAVAEALEQLTRQPLGFDLIKWREFLRAQKEKPAVESASPSETGESAAYAFPPPQPPLAQAVDLAVVFDTTGSMLHIWPQVSAAIDGIIGELMKQSKSLRVATVKYRASDPRAMSRYLIAPKPFSRDLRKMRDDILDASFGGGSGGLHLGLHYALSALAWRSQSRKLVLIIGDTTPNGEGALQCLRLIEDASQTDGVLVSTLFVKNTHGEEHRETYRRLALGGRGRFYEYNKAESHLVDMLQAKIDVRKTELYGETARKLLAPRAAK